MFKRIMSIALALLLAACGGGGGAESPTNQSASSTSPIADSIVPATLVDTKITLVDTEIQELLTGVKIASVDKTILTFDNQRLVVHSLDGRTLPSIYGYSFIKNGSSAWVTSTKGGDTYAIKLTFNDKSSGTFQETYTGFDGVQSLFRSGNFTLENKSFSLAPESIINTAFHLNFKTASSTLEPEESPVVGERFKLSFQKNNAVLVEPSNLSLVKLDASYSVNASDNFSLEVRGVYAITKHAFKLNVRFDTLTSGTFTLDVGDGKATATGDFDTIKFTPIDKFPIKGRFVGASTITSSNTKITYGYEVYLPPDYQASGKNYPVVYVTDGQWYTDFAYLLDKKSKDVIMVAIDEGTKDRRMKDFLPDGSPLYTKFLKEEFIPLIESTYRTNSERTFVGVSAGGLLGAYLLSVEPVGAAYFKNYILIDGSMFGVTTAIIAAEEARYKSNNSLPLNVLLAATPQGNGWFVNAFAQRYVSRRYSDFSISNQEFRVTHDEMGPLAFDALIDKLY